MSKLFSFCSTARSALQAVNDNRAARGFGGHFGGHWKGSSIQEEKDDTGLGIR